MNLPVTQSNTPFLKGGSQTISVTVRDVRGLETSASVEVSVVDNAPLTEWSRFDVDRGDRFLWGIECFDEETLVVFGEDSIQVSSDQGQTWEEAESIPSDVSVRGMIRHNGIYYAAGTHNDDLRGVILRATSAGGDWEEVPLPNNTERLLDIAVSSNGIFVAVGLRGQLVRSTDGLVWAHQFSRTSEDLRGVTVTSDDTFVAVGGTGDMFVMYSNNLYSDEGLLWFQPAYPLFPKASTDVTFANGRLVATDSWGWRLAVGSDGEGWSNQTTVYLENGGTAGTGVAYGSGFFLGVGRKNLVESRGTRQDIFALSKDGERWADLNVHEDYFSLQAVCYCDGRFYAVGNDDGDGVVFRSPVLEAVEGTIGRAEWLCGVAGDSLSRRRGGCGS